MLNQPNIITKNLVKYPPLSIFFTILCVVVTFLACDDQSTRSVDISESDTGIPDAFIPMPVELVPGRSIGPVTIGMSVAELKAVLGEPNRAIGFRRTSNLTYEDVALEIVVSTMEDLEVTDSSKVIASVPCLMQFLRAPLR